MRFVVENELFEKIPDVCFGVVVARGIGNRAEKPEIEEMLQENIRKCEEHFEGQKVKEAPEVLCYREAMRSLGFNPNKYMCSIEALLTRIAKGKGFPHINAAVDLGNAVSIGHGIPIGAHDINSAEGDFTVRVATEGDIFIPFGCDSSPENEDNPDEGEIIYASGSSVRTRRWTWRQSEKGKITEDTTDIFFPLDGFTGINRDEVIRARDELADKLKQYFGAEIRTGMVDRDNPVFETDW